MGAFLSHLDLMPLFYGIIMFLGIASMYHKAIHFMWGRLSIEILTFILVFTLHGGTMTGGFSAMVCALLSGAFLGRKRKS
jgi:hypothetical protein